MKASQWPVLSYRLRIVLHAQARIRLLMVAFSCRPSRFVVAEVGIYEKKIAGPLLLHLAKLLLLMVMAVVHAAIRRHDYNALCVCVRVYGEGPSPQPRPPLDGVIERLVRTDLYFVYCWRGNK